MAAPRLDRPIVDQTATEGRNFTLTFPANTFSDADPGQTLTYTATLLSGGALPNWLSFNAATRTFTGTPPTNSPDITVRLTARDPTGQTARDEFVIATPSSTPATLAIAAGANGGADKNEGNSGTTPFTFTVT
ncbi:MAG: putative Ig domain-containing protein, partial [Niveispirillum sp.]|uniref:putative Ig domain-containing protein n=1 Tax=Niveispirillum sp. TaxID=1917217 RepID=UPI003BA72AB8